MVHTLITVQRLYLVTLWFPLPVEFMLPRYLLFLLLSMDCVLINNQRENSSVWLSRGRFVTIFECCFLLKCLLIPDVYPAGR